MSAAATHTLADLAARFDMELRGAGKHVVSGVGTLTGATPDRITFLANPHYRAQLETTRAGAVILHRDQAANCPGNCLIAADPYVAFAKIAALFEPDATSTPGVHPTAVIASGAVIAASASIGPFCSVAANASIDAGAVLGAHCSIGEHCRVGTQSRLIARVTLVRDVSLGQRVLVHPGAVIGADGFGLAFDQDHWIKVPQLGGVRIGDDCEIGANTTIDRGALEDTVLEDDVRLDNQIQIAHNVHIGAHTAMAGCAAVAGSARIGRYCLIGGGAGILGHLEIADRVTITARALVTHSIRVAGEYSVRRAAAGQPEVAAQRGTLQAAGRFGPAYPGTGKKGHEVMSESDPITAPVDIERIMSMLPHRYPFLLVDRVLSHRSGQEPARDQERHRQRALLPGSLPGPSGDAGRADRRGARAGVWPARVPVHAQARSPTDVLLWSRSTRPSSCSSSCPATSSCSKWNSSA